MEREQLDEKKKMRGRKEKEESNIERKKKGIWNFIKP